LLLIISVLKSGCGAKQVPPSPEAVALTARHYTNQALEFLAMNPPLAQKAREAALDALALDKSNVEARLALSDAHFQLKKYQKSRRVLKPLRDVSTAQEEVLYREARAYYWYHSYWVFGSNYERARTKAQACIAAGDKYLMECSAIIRNSYLGEAKSDPAKLPAAYRQARASAEELLGKLPPGTIEWANTCLVLAEIDLVHLDNEASGKTWLAQASSARDNHPNLRTRIETLERQYELRKILERGEQPTLAK
jgi:tetratricopeptide (TPR) repeat protein